MTVYNNFNLIPKGKYNLLALDPPWEYNNKGVDGAVDKQYKTMSDEALAKLDVGSLAADPCILLMWVTSPKLYEAQPLFDAWGFKYKTFGFVWDKEVPGTGFYTGQQVEVCLLGTKGSATELVVTKLVSNLIRARKTVHSRKPLEFFLRVDKIFGKTIPKLELFARQPIAGWDSFGNQVEEVITLG
jgi:N6-adenosine-specific RNA methylase IME4